MIMRVFENLEPRDVFYYFEEICRIPHGSGNLQQISDYLVSFAEEQHLAHCRDEYGNVIMVKEASEGYEDHAPVMLQGHMDMVAVKKQDCDIDMKTEGLRIQVDGDRVYAEGTSLGGDDGIAVAYGLALMAGNYKHPKIELVITAEEETGMDGARGIDLSGCQSRKLINLDSEEEGVFLAGCAGGARVNYNASLTPVMQKGTVHRVTVDGLLGGHSGAEIDKERGNAICILGRAMKELEEAGLSIALCNIDGGLADNAIPRQAEAVFLVTGYKGNGEEKEILEKVMEKLQEGLATEYRKKDPGARLQTEILDTEERMVLSEEDSRRLIDLICMLPYGVQAMSSSMKGLVETSLNPGVISLKQGQLHVGISVRSSVDSAKQGLFDRLSALAQLAGVEMEITGNYPGFAYKEDSPLCSKMSEVYENMYGRRPEVMAIHAGLELGFFAGKIKGLDCISMGPDMKNIHTTEEELSISSVKRVWKYLLQLLEEM